jgi:hypothetical protein
LFWNTFGGVKLSYFRGMPGGEYHFMFTDDVDQVVITLGMDLKVSQELKFVGASAWRYSLNSLIGQSFVTRQQVDNTAIGETTNQRDKSVPLIADGISP